MKTEAKSFLRHYISRAKKGKITMTWKEYAHMIRVAYEQGLYDPDSIEDIEEWMDVDITDISSFPGHYADEDMYLKEDDEDGKSIE